MYKLLTFLSIITLVSSCGNKEREDDLATKRIATIEIKKLGDKYKAIQNWDTLDYDYTIHPPPPHYILMGGSNNIYCI